MVDVNLAQSKNEVNYCAALDQLKVGYDQQVNLGLWGLRGSQKIDILAYTAPRPTAIFIQGRYWHNAKTSVEDTLKQLAAEDAGYRVVTATEEESDTVDAAVAHARRNVL